MKNIIYVFLGLFIFSCDEFDPNSGVPDITGLEHDCGETECSSPSVTLSWEGNEFASDYSYRLELSEDDVNNYPFEVDTYKNWSNWSTETSVTLTYLDEGIYDFYVKSRFNLETEQGVATYITFEIDAIAGAALRMYPLRQTGNTSENATFDIYLFAEEIDPVIGLNVVLLYDPLLTYTSYAIGYLFSNYELVYDEEAFVFEQVSEDGIIQFSCVVAGTGISGSGSLVKLTFSHNLHALGNTTIEIEGDSGDTFIQDAEDNYIPLGTPVNGIIQLVP